MDDTLQRLLDAEMQAERLAKEAEEKRERIMHEAKDEAHQLEASFEDRIPELQSAWIRRATERAEKTTAEIERRYDERHQRLRGMAETREEEALEAAFRVLTDPEL